MTLQPALPLRGPVRRVVFDDQAQVQCRRRLGVSLLQTLDRPPISMPRHPFRDEALASGDRRRWFNRRRREDPPGDGFATKCRRSLDAGQGLGTLHFVCAWASEEGLALGQVATEQESHEIAAFPRLLEQISLTNTLITIDAMGCQKAIAEDIVDGGGDFAIAVKDNHSHSHAVDCSPASRDVRSG